MKFICKIKGEIDHDQCYNCFQENKRDFSSRVLCKKENVVEVKQDN